MSKTYLKFAFRALRKGSWYTVIDFIGLTIGISTCLVIFLICRFELSFDKFHPDKERIFRLVTEEQHTGDAEPYYLNNVSHAASHIIAKEYPGVEQTSDFYTYGAHVIVPGAGKQARQLSTVFARAGTNDMIIVGPEFFAIFKYEWLAGSPLSALTNPFKVVLTEGEAQKYFGALPVDRMLGREVIYDDSLHLMVSGIVKDWQGNSDFGFRDFISFSTIGRSFLRNAPGFDDPNKPDSWGERTFAQTYIKLKKDVRTESARAWMAAVINPRRPVNRAGGINEKGEKFSIDLQPLSELHFDTKYQKDHYSRQAHLPILYGMMSISAFILIIAIVNFVNLSTARSISRAKEIGILKVLGGSRKDIVWQFLIETSIVVLFAAIISILIASPVLNSFSAFLPPGLEPSEIFSLPAFLFLIIIIALTTLSAGSYPAFVLSSHLPSQSLKGEISGSSGQKPLIRSSLIVLQFSISLFLIIAALIVGRQIHFMLGRELGFEKGGIININVNSINPNLHYTPRDIEVFAERLRNFPKVRLVSINDRPVALDWDPTIWFIDKETGNKIAMSCRFADQNYVPLFGLRIIAGRNIRTATSDTICEFMINESCSRILGFQDPQKAIGHRVSCIHANGTVVGVITDFNSLPLQKPITPLFIAGYKGIGGTVSVKLLSARDQFDHARTITTDIKKTWKEIFPTEEFFYSFYDDEISRFYNEEEQHAKILNAAVGIAILISSMGLFGMSTYSIGLRVKEIGIRKALGASVSRIVLMLWGQFLEPVFASILIASPVAWFFLNRWLQNYAYRINISWWVFAAVASAALIIASITVSYQSLKAALANPVKILKSE